MGSTKRASEGAFAGWYDVGSFLECRQQSEYQERQGLPALPRQGVVGRVLRLRHHVLAMTAGSAERRGWEQRFLAIGATLERRRVWHGDQDVQETEARPGRKNGDHVSLTVMVGPATTVGHLKACLDEAMDTSASGMQLTTMDHSIALSDEWLLERCLAESGTVRGAPKNTAHPMSGNQNTRKYNSCNSFFYLCTNNKSVYLLLSIEQYSHYRSLLLLLLLLLLVLLMLLADEESLPCAGSDWVEHLCPQPLPWP